MSKNIIVDGDKTPKEPIIGENKSGSKTANGNSAKQLNYRFKRKYGDDEFARIMGTIEEKDQKSVD